MLWHNDHLPFSHRWQSSLFGRTTCDFLCHSHHSSGCQISWSGLPGAGFSADPSGRSKSEKEIVPTGAKNYRAWSTQRHTIHPFNITNILLVTVYKRAIQNTGETMASWWWWLCNHLCIPCQTQSFRRSGSADQRKREGNQQPFHRRELREPTSPQLCCSPGGSWAEQ